MHDRSRTLGAAATPQTFLRSALAIALASLSAAACDAPPDGAGGPAAPGAPAADQIQLSTSELLVIADKLHAFAPNSLGIAGTTTCLDVPNFSIEDGTVLGAYSCNGGINQDFRFVPGSTKNEFQVRGNETGKCVVPTGDGRIQLQTCHGLTASYWIVVGGNNLYLQNKATGQCLRPNGSGIALGACDGGADVWMPKIKDRGGRATLRPTHAPNECLDVKADNTNPVQQFACHGRNNQRWFFSADDNDRDLFTIISNFNRECLDVPNGNAADGVAIIHYPCKNVVNQKWRVEMTGIGVYRIRNEYTGKCLDIPGAATGDTTELHQWTCNGGANQNFFIGAPPPNPEVETDSHHQETDELSALQGCTDQMNGLPTDRYLGLSTGWTNVPSFDDRSCYDYGWLEGYAQGGTYTFTPKNLGPNITTSAWDCNHSTVTYGVFVRDIVNDDWGSWKWVGGGTAFGKLVNGVCQHDPQLSNLPRGSGTRTVTLTAGSTARQYRVATASWQHNDTALAHPGDACQELSCFWPVNLDIAKQ